MTKSAAAEKPVPNFLNDYHLLAFDELDSTNEEAKRMAHKGGTHGAVIWAKKQTAGRGREDRKWVSEEGNLFVSMLLQPQCAVGQATELSFVAAVATHDALTDIFGDSKPVELKWPNDMIVNNKKIAGILLESFRHPDILDQMWVIVGIGINVESHPDGTPFPATSLKGEGVELVSAKIVLSRLIHHFVERYNQWQAKGFAKIRKDWLAAAWRKGEEISVNLPGETVKGICKGIEEDGSLILQTAKGKRVLQFGDVFG